MTSIIYTVWLREMKRFWRAKSRFIGSLMMPIIWLGIMGVGLSSSFTAPGMDYFQFVGPGVIGMTIMFASIFSAISVIWERQFGFLKEMLVSPASRTKILLGKLLGSATISTANGIMVLLMAILFGSLRLSSLSLPYVLLGIVFMALIALSFVSVGLVIASRMNNMEGFQMVMSFLVMPFFFLSGAFFPLENVPWWMKFLSSIDPLRYGVDGLRYTLTAHSELSLALDFGVLAGFTLLMVVIASYMFKKL